MSTVHLLNTAEAARFLRVSQASIRRWSDSGLLASQRIGRRRERRFLESDLLEFMSPMEAKRAPASQVNVGGISVAAPAHLMPLYSTDAGGLRLTVPFLAEGIRLGQPTFLVASGDDLQRYLHALDNEEAVDTASAVKRGLLTVIKFKRGTAAAAIAEWESNFARAVAKGPTLIRIVGEMTCERTMFTSEEEMLRYEEAFEVMSRRYPIAVLCQYDVRKFEATAVLRALKAHPDMYLLRIGTFLN